MIFSSQTLLRTLSFTNTASEPSGQPREVSLSVTQNGGVPPSCSVMVTVALINDNVPVVDLSGPAVPSVNYSTSPQRAIASPTARLVDCSSLNVYSWFAGLLHLPLFIEYVGKPYCMYILIV